MKGRSIIPRKLDFQVAVWLIALMHTCFPVMASGEGIRDFRDGWLLNPGDMASILAPDEMPPSVGDEPLRASAPGGHWGLWAGVGQGALFSMVDLPLKFLEGGIVHRGHRWPWSLAGSWERLGDMLMVEETTTIGLRLGRNPQIGLRMRGRRLLVEGMKVDAGLEAALEGRLKFQLGADLAGTLALWMHPSPAVRWHRGRGRRALAELKFFFPGSGLAVRLEQRGDGAPVLSVEILGRLSAGLGVGFRTDPETGSLGGCLVAKIGGPWMRTSHLVHPALGVTHRFHLGAGDPAACIW